MKVLGGIFLGLIAFALIFGLGWVTMGNDFFMYKFFAPKYEQARRETYEQTKSYREGSVQRLDTLCTQVTTTDDGHKTLLNDVIRHEFAEWDTGDVPSYLRNCLTLARK